MLGRIKTLGGFEASADNVYRGAAAVGAEEAFVVVEPAEAAPLLARVLAILQGKRVPRRSMSEPTPSIRY